MDVRILALLVLAGLAPRPASAQTIARFAPAALDPNASAFELRFVREHAPGILTQPWPTRDAGWLFVRGEGWQHNYDALEPLASDATRLDLEREGPGPLLVGWDMPPRTEPMPLVKLRAFLAERSGERSSPRAVQALAGDEPVHVLRLESLALIVGPPAGAPAAGPSAVPISKGGLRMELRALFDPSSLATGSDLPFRLYLPEGGRQDVHVRCVHLESRAARLLELTEDGSVRARLDLPGAWMLEASRVRALDGSPAALGAALELASTTLVFVVPAGETGKGK
jgi:hypothetical protein